MIIPLVPSRLNIDCDSIDHFSLGFCGSDTPLNMRTNFAFKIKSDLADVIPQFLNFTGVEVLWS